MSVLLVVAHYLGKENIYFLTDSYLFPVTICNGNKAVEICEEKDFVKVKQNIKRYG